MDVGRKQAYTLILSAGFVHLKWDLAQFWHGLDWWHPWRLFHQSRSIQKAAHRAVTFHNLAIFLTHDMKGFCEDRFWQDVEKLRRRFPEDDWRCNYRELFEKNLFIFKYFA